MIYKLSSIPRNTKRYVALLFEFHFSDLSQTSIESLPVEGLENIEMLKIEDTTTMKTIPSIYEFKVCIALKLT